MSRPLAPDLKETTMSKPGRIVFEVTIMHPKKANEILCSVRARDTSEAEAFAGADMGIDPARLIAARVCRANRVRGSFVKTAR